MEPIRTVLVDDEPDAREGVRHLLEPDADIALVGEGRDGREAVELVERLEPELLFLDVQMPELDGFSALASIAESARPVVVFITAYDEYAVRAFEVHALDYLLKPFSDERFANTLQRAKDHVRQRRAGALGQRFAALFGDVAIQASSREGPGSDQPNASEPGQGEGRYYDRILVKTAKGSVFIRAEEIDWIQADDYYARLHVGDRGYLIRETMQSLEERLDPRQFVRVHRSAIVNVDRVQSLQPYFRGKHILTLKDGTRVTMSRSRRANFERAVGWRL